MRLGLAAARYRHRVRQPRGRGLLAPAGSRSGAGAVSGAHPFRCEHTFVTSDGNPYARFKRALADRQRGARHRRGARAPRIALDDALRICLVLREGDPRRYERAAVRWLGRFALEAGGRDDRRPPAGRRGARHASRPPGGGDGAAAAAVRGAGCGLTRGRALTCRADRTRGRVREHLRSGVASGTGAPWRIPAVDPAPAREPRALARDVAPAARRPPPPGAPAPAAAAAARRAADAAALRAPPPDAPPVLRRGSCVAVAVAEAPLARPAGDRRAVLRAARGDVRDRPGRQGAPRPVVLGRRRLQDPRARGRGVARREVGDGPGVHDLRLPARIDRP